MLLPKITLVYDTECPMCRYYVVITNIEASITAIELVSARSEHPLLEEIKHRGLDVNAGFVLVVGEVFYHGSEAINRLALLGSRHGFVNRCNYWIFSSPRRAQILYPLLARGRRCLLWLLGIKNI